MHIYVINLQREAYRRRFISRQLEQLGMPFTLIEAEDAQGYTPDQQAAAAHVGQGPHACTRSHQMAYRRMLADGVTHALVLEDDVRLAPHLPALLAQLPEHLGTRDLLLLSYRHKHSDLLLRAGIRLGYGALLCPTQAQDMVSAAAYVIGRDLAAQMLAFNEPVRYVCDEWSQYAHLWERFYVLYPSPAVEDRGLGSSRDMAKGGLSRLLDRLVDWDFPLLSALVRQRRERLFYKDYGRVYLS